jgi:hypothetical protein
MLETVLAWVVWPALISGVVAWITAQKTISFNQEKLRREFQLEFATEAAINVLLADGNDSMRSFSKIKHHLPGFNDDDLRRHLIRAGAVCFTNPSSGEELWGLLEKHRGEAFK